VRSLKSFAAELYRSLAKKSQPYATALFLRLGGVTARGGFCCVPVNAVGWNALLFEPEKNSELGWRSWGTHQMEQGQTLAGEQIMGTTPLVCAL